MHMRAAQLEARQIGHLFGELDQVLRLDSALGGLRNEGYLDTGVERRRMKGALFGQAPGHAPSIDAVHPVEALGDGPGLVRLQGPDEMPAHRGPA